MIRRLEARGLVEALPSGAQLTAAGQRALTDGSYTVHVHERHPFYFLDSPSPEQPPAFLPLLQPLRTAPRDTPAPAIDVSWLMACIEQEPSWKRRHRFPGEVEAVLSSAAGAAEADAWRRVVLVSAELAWLLLVRVAGDKEGGGLLGFSLQSEGWVLHGEKPALALEDSWPEVLPELAEEPSLEAWQQAWHLWCQPRRISAAEAAACRLERSGHQLLVHAPHRVIERLRAARSDAVKGEAWLLGGQGRIRPAALIRLADDLPH
jgi:hypothetical protein